MDTTTNQRRSPYCSRVRGLAYAKGINLEVINSSKEIKKMNPIGKIPTLQLDNGDVLIESDVINEYLNDAFAGPNFRPKDPKAAAKSATVCRIVDLYMAPHFNTFWTPKVPKESVDKAVAEISKYLDIIESMIAGPYVAGVEMSLGDWNLGGTLPMVSIFWGRKGFDAFKGRPKLTAWYAKMHENEAFLKMEDEILVAAKVRPAKAKM